MISEGDNLMSHVASLEIDRDGTAYLLYYRDKTQPKERREYSTIELVMDSFNARKWRSSKITRYDVMRCGQIVGDYTQDADWAPYDPVLKLEGKTLHCIFMGGKDGGICVRNFNTAGKAFADTVSRCTMSWGDRREYITTESIKECYSFFGIENESIDPKNKYSTILDKNFVEKDGWYYNAMSIYLSPQARTFILRTKDFVNYEVVFVCKEFKWGSTENSIQIVGEEMVVMTRTAKPDDKSKRGVWIAKYSLDGKCLIQPFKLGPIESRMALISENGKLYAFCNVNPCVKDPGGLMVHRSRVGIFEFDSKLEQGNRWDVVCPYGISYYDLVKWNGRWFISFTEDRNIRDATRAEPKGDIAFCELGL